MTPCAVTAGPVAPNKKSNRQKGVSPARDARVSPIPCTIQLQGMGLSLSACEDCSSKCPRPAPRTTTTPCCPGPSAVPQTDHRQHAGATTSSSRWQERGLLTAHVRTHKEGKKPDSAHFEHHARNATCPFSDPLAAHTCAQGQAASQRRSPFSRRASGRQRTRPAGQVQRTAERAACHAAATHARHPATGISHQSAAPSIHKLSPVTAHHANGTMASKTPVTRGRRKP